MPDPTEKDLQDKYEAEAKELGLELHGNMSSQNMLKAIFDFKAEQGDKPKTKPKTKKSEGPKEPYWKTRGLLKSKKKK
ncbi:MAG: hypothetical protein JRE23_16940 [Deltaproteobacteria bacterium]|nr:hypothetical protein [Deltaproteobacteria bacterium]